MSEADTLGQLVLGIGTEVDGHIKQILSIPPPSSRDDPECPQVNEHGSMLTPPPVLLPQLLDLGSNDGHSTFNQVRYDHDERVNGCVNRQEFMRRSVIPFPFKCGHCPRQFLTLAGRTSHEKTHPEKELLRCLDCPKTFTHVNDLVQHSYIHKVNLPESSSYGSTPSTGGQGSHVKDRHNFSAQPMKLTLDMLQKKNIFDFECQLCKLVCPNYLEAVRHGATHKSQAK